MVKLLKLQFCLVKIYKMRGEIHKCGVSKFCIKIAKRGKVGKIGKCCKVKKNIFLILTILLRLTKIISNV